MMTTETEDDPSGGAASPFLPDADQQLAPSPGGAAVAPSPPEKNKKKPPKPPRKCRREAFVIEEVHRSQIKNAPYNPRVISDAAREKLRKNLRKVGLTHPLTWNRRTGNLLSGHQRLSIIDSFERTQDYVLTVSVVDMDEQTEKQQNVFENNREAGGDFDEKLLRELIAEPTFDSAAAGFDLSEVVERFGEETLAASSEKLAALSEAIREAAARNERIKSKSDDSGRTDFYRVVVFKDGAQADRLSAFNEEYGCVFLHGARLIDKMTALGAVMGIDNNTTEDQTSDGPA